MKYRETNVRLVNLNEHYDQGERYAFFDVDGTLITIKSMFSFRRYCLGRLGLYRGWKGALRYITHDLKHRSLVRLGAGRERLNRVYYRAFRGVNRAELLGLIDEWYEEINRSGGLYISRTMQILREHRDAGVKVVVVSGSFHELLHPILENIGVDHVLATNLETKGGEFTGEIVPPQMIGEGKARAVKDFIESKNIDPAACYAYGDDSSDIPMLSVVGSPALVTSDPGLIDLAGRRAWRVIAQE